MTVSLQTLQWFGVYKIYLLPKCRQESSICLEYTEIACSNPRDGLCRISLALSSHRLSEGNHASCACSTVLGQCAQITLIGCMAAKAGIEIGRQHQWLILWPDCNHPQKAEVTCSHTVGGQASPEHTASNSQRAQSIPSFPKSCHVSGHMQVTPKIAAGCIASSLSGSYRQFGATVGFCSQSWTLLCAWPPLSEETVLQNVKADMGLSHNKALQLRLYMH